MNIFEEELPPADLSLFYCWMERVSDCRDDVDDMMTVVEDVYKWNKKDFVDMLRRMV